jgi:hypothetical protein
VTVTSDLALLLTWTAQSSSYGKSYVGGGSTFDAACQLPLEVSLTVRVASSSRSSRLTIRQAKRSKEFFARSSWAPRRKEFPAVGQFLSLSLQSACAVFDFAQARSLEWLIWCLGCSSHTWCHVAQCSAALRTASSEVIYWLFRSLPPIRQIASQLSNASWVTSGAGLKRAGLFRALRVWRTRHHSVRHITLIS